MAYQKKSWREKLDDARGLPRLAKIDLAKRNTWGLKRGDTVLIPLPRDVDGLMKRVPAGKVVTTRDLQQALARRHGATTCCPLCTGIFAWIAAHAAEEERADGAKRITPYWRTLKAKGEINAKFPGGAAGCARKLRAEGQKVVKRGEKYFVVEFELRMAKVS